MSHVRYGLLCYGRTNKQNLNDINVLMNKALRCIHHKKYDESVRKIRLEKKLLNVKSMFFHELGLFMFKFKNNMLPSNFNNYFKSIKNVHKYNTRSSKINFFLPRYNKNSGQKSLAYQGSKLWTELPLSLKDLSHFGKFQEELKILLLNSDKESHK